MRIGVFELDCVFQPLFVLAQVRSKKARLLRAIHIRNVRGTEKDWLRLHAEIQGRSTRKKVVRDLRVGDEAAARAVEAGILEGLVLPDDFVPGKYTARLLINDAAGETEILFSFEVLPRQVIPTDFVRAPLLSAYISTDDALKAFASRAVDGQIGLTAKETLRLLYEALSKQELSYQPVNLTCYPDCQEISRLSHTLRTGGSCSDLSLLFASLLSCRGIPPALILFTDHMAAGCFTDDEPPAFETLEGSAAILSLLETGKLAAVECTAVCRYLQADEEEAAGKLLRRLRTGAPCVLINVRQVLANGTAARLPDEWAGTAPCPGCGYPCPPDGGGEGILCPACGRRFIPGGSENAPPARPDGEGEEIVSYSAMIQYGLARGNAYVIHMLAADEKTVRVAPSWQGHTVRAVGPRAFLNGTASQVILPDTVVSVGDYAFQNCVQLHRLAVPPYLSEIGTGAFTGSGLTEIRLPGKVRRVARMAFANCPHLTKVELEEGIELIDERAFENCVSLRSVVIPASVRQIARNAFDRSCELLMTSGKTVFI